MCVSIVKKDKENNKIKDYFLLQFHVTSRCDQYCRHCYLVNSSYFKDELNNELTYTQCKKIIDDYCEFLEMNNFNGIIAFTGGDPLIRSDFFEILQYSSKKNIKMISVLGNPQRITVDTAKMLKDNGVILYQLSLDGLKDTHDSIRKEGSFDNTLRAIEILKNAGIKTSIMFTVSKFNKDELIDVIKLAHELGVDSFDFDRYVPVKKFSQLEMITPSEYLDLLLKVNEEYKFYSEKDTKTIFGYKDNLWGLIKGFQMIENRNIPEGYVLERGCAIGKSALVVRANGDVLACSRLPIILGNALNSTIYDVFYNSSLLDTLKNMDCIENCGKCDNLSNCGGCRAVAYGIDHEYFSKDPQCFKQILKSSICNF